MAHKDVKKYTFVTKLLHWLIALIVLTMLSIGFFMSSLPDAFKPQVYALHKSFGLTVLALMLLRIVIITYYGRPRLPTRISRLEKISSRAIQYSFYVLLLVLPLSGWIMSTAGGRVPIYFGLLALPFPGVSHNQALSSQADLIHCILAWVVLILVLLHIAIGLSHRRDGLLKRMWF